MIRIIQYRDKCIGCNACVEIHKERWRISKKDGKSILLKARSKKGIFIIEVEDEEYFANMEAAKACPVKIIKVEKIK